MDLSYVTVSLFVVLVESQCWWVIDTNWGGGCLSAMDLRLNFTHINTCSILLLQCICTVGVSMLSLRISLRL